MVPAGRQRRRSFERPRSVPLVAALALFVLGFPELVAGGLTTLTGTVECVGRDGGRKPIRGVKVLAECLVRNRVQSFSQVTGPDGKYTFQNLPNSGATPGFKMCSVRALRKTVSPCCWGFVPSRCGRRRKTVQNRFGQKRIGSGTYISNFCFGSTPACKLVVPGTRRPRPRRLPQPRTTPLPRPRPAPRQRRPSTNDGSQRRPRTPLPKGAATTQCPRGSANGRPQFVGWTSQSNNRRTSLNTQEYVLSKQNINNRCFGLLTNYPVDGPIVVQPLLVPNVNIAGRAVSVVFVATEAASVYAFDTDTGRRLWSRNFIANKPNVDLVTTRDVACDDNSGSYGISGTPVVDLQRNLLYVVVNTDERQAPGKDVVFRIYALDLATGVDKIPGRNGGSVPLPFKSGAQTLTGLYHTQRAALALDPTRDLLLVTFSSRCDISNWHGYLHAIRVPTMVIIDTYVTTPGGKGAGIWMSGGAPSFDKSGNIYLSTGNGDFNEERQQFSNGILKFALTNDKLVVVDYFVPSNQADLNRRDNDQGSTSVTILEDQRVGDLLIQGGKGGDVYILKATDLGKYTPPTDQCRAADNYVPCEPRVVEYLSYSWKLYTWFAYWPRAHMGLPSLGFFQMADTPLRQLTVSGGRVTRVVAKDDAPWYLKTKRGAYTVITTDGGSDAIVWGLHEKSGDAVLVAYDAVSLAILYDSSLYHPQDRAGQYPHSGRLLVANGKVYVPTMNSLAVYGLRQ